MHVANQPADRRHQFGHHKAEYFSAVLEGVLIVIAALLIFREAYAALIAPRSLDDPLQGILINGLATALNAGWSYFLISWGRQQRSPALVADGWHLLTDVATSVGVLVGLALAAMTGWQILDPALAALVAVLLGGFLGKLLSGLGGDWVVGGDHLVRVPEAASLEEAAALIQLPAATKLADVVKALSALGATPQDLLAILQAMKSAGALNAELEVI